MEQRKVLMFAAYWGVLGFAALLARALIRLTPVAVEPIEQGLLSTWQVVGYVCWCVYMAYSEGYRGFQLNVAPRVVARAMHLSRNPKPLHVILAPIFCMSLFHAPRRRLVISWSVLAGIVALVIAVHHLEQPWRGMVDGGVVVGLGWGLIAQLWFFRLGLRGQAMPVSAELP